MGVLGRFRPAGRPGKGGLMTPAVAGPFEVSCAALHPIRCDVRLHAASVDGLLDRAREHGMFDHGFTPAWYSSERLATMGDVIAREDRG